LDTPEAGSCPNAADIDEAIVLLKREGDGALEGAVELLQGAVFAFSMRVCGQQQDAEDTMQESC